MDYIFDLMDKKTIVMRLDDGKILMQIWDKEAGKHSDVVMTKDTGYCLATILLDMIVKGDKL